VASMQYWRRWSPSALLTENLHVPLPKADLIDPPQAYPGSGTVLFDMEGRLIALETIPSAKADAATSRAVNWAALLEAAGRDPARVVSTVPPAGFVAAADTVAAWRLSDSTAPETTLVAAAIRGRVVRVDTFARGNALGQLALVADDAALTAQVWAIFIFILILPMIGGIIIARHNLRKKRGDIRGALVVGISIVLLNLLMYLLSADAREAGLFAILLGVTARAPLGYALVRGVTMAIAYLAIEPYLRRLWPSVLVSWARLVAGRLRDPILGRDLLVGASAGAALQLLSVAAQVVERALGFRIPPAQLSANLLQTMVSTPSVLAFVCLALFVGLQRVTTGFTIMLIFRFVLRSNRLAILATFLFFFLAFLDFGSKALLMEALAWFLSLALLLWVYLRFGYVAGAISMSVVFITDGLAWTLDFSSWVAPQTMFAWGIMAVVLGYGFITAVRGRSLFNDPLSDPVATAVRARK
jgi:eukaryotic-like serine/threonine-protein kinase